MNPRGACTPKAFQELRRLWLESAAPCLNRTVVAGVSLPVAWIGLSRLEIMAIFMATGALGCLESSFDDPTLRFSGAVGNAMHSGSAAGQWNCHPAGPSAGLKLCARRSGGKLSGRHRDGRPGGLPGAPWRTPTPKRYGHSPGLRSSGSDNASRASTLWPGGTCSSWRTRTSARTVLGDDYGRWLCRAAAGSSTPGTATGRRW